MRGVWREAVVERCDACNFTNGMVVRLQEVRERGLNAARVLGWVAPGAAVDIAV